MIKIGTDICSVSRISEAYARFGERFLDRILTAQEKRYVLSRPQNLTVRLAARFAAKEAAAKALGTGMRGVGWHEIEVVSQSSGEPKLQLHGRALTLAKERGLDYWEVSISHEREYAVASVLSHSGI